MLEDVLAALAEAPLAGIMVNTLDPLATELARRYGARVVTDGARDGHTGAVAAMARILAEEGREAMLTVPGDIPRVTAAEIAAVIEARRPAPSLTIVPAHDERGSNAVLCSPPLVMPLRFGDDSFLPHLAAARALGIEPTIVKLAGHRARHRPARTIAGVAPCASARMTTRAISAYLETRGLVACVGRGDLSVDDQCHSDSTERQARTRAGAACRIPWMRDVVA